MGSFKQHYVEEHNVDENKYLFQHLFTRDRYFCPRKYFRCDYFCHNGRDEKVHNCFEHYQSRKTLPSEDKTMKITYFYRDLQNYCISFCKQGEFLYDPREVISEFLMFEQNFVPTPNLEKVVFKGSLTIINRQPPPSVGLLRLPIQELGLRISIKQFILMVLSSLVSQMA